MPDKLAVDTATFGNSIWRKVGWNAFRHHIVALQRASNEVPSDPLVHSATQWQAAHRESNDDVRTLPFDVEQRLADDIAFLAAAEEGPKEVSAVVLEEQYEPRGLIIRLATNQSVPRGVEDTLRTMFDLLSQCSKRKLSRDICRDSLFDLVMNVSKNRIHGRLQSVHWDIPKSRTGAKDREPLHLGIQKVATGIERHQGLARADTISLQDKMRHLCDLLERIDRCGRSTPECEQLLREIVKRSYELCTSAGTTTLEESMRYYGVVNSEIYVVKHIRQVDKIGRYWGLCVSMTEDSRKYGKIFANVQLQALCPYQAKTSNIAFTKGQHARCLVHAEIQILVFYSMIPNVDLKKPRVIGVSKAACYLCNLFIQEHGQFFITKTHGRLHERWNFPDLDDFDPGERVKLHRVLAAVDKQLQTATVTARKGLKKRQHPMGSWLTLPPARHVSPVPSTVKSVASKDPTRSDEGNLDPNIAHVPDESLPPKPQTLPTSPLAPTPPPTYAAGRMDQRNSSVSSATIASWELPTQREFTAAAPVWARIGGVSLTFEAEGTARGSVAIARTLDKDKYLNPANVINVDALKVGEVKEFVREVESEDIVLRLNHGRGQKSQITLRWPGFPISHASRTT